MKEFPELRVPGSLRRSLELLNQDRLGWLDKAAAMGPLVRLRTGPVTNWVLTHPDAARQILLTDALRWARLPSTRRPVRMAVGENLFSQSQRSWAQLEPSLGPGFRKSALASRLSDIEALAADDVASWPIDAAIDLEANIGRLALVVAAWVLFGDHLSAERADELAFHQRRVIDWVGQRTGRMIALLPIAPGAQGRRMRQHRAVLHTYAGELVNHRRKSDNEGDILSALLAARPKGRALRDSQLRGHIVGLLGAGNETTAAALTWALAYGAEYPEHFSSVAQDTDAARNYATEVLRLAPPAWAVTRSPVRSASIRVDDTSVTMHLGSVVIIYLRGMNRHPTTWRDPEIFDPNRHTADTKGQQRSLIPFGLGPRGCIGQHLAMAELLTILPILANKGRVVVESELHEDPSFALRIVGGLRGRFVARASSS